MSLLTHKRLMLLKHPYCCEDWLAISACVMVSCMALWDAQIDGKWTGKQAIVMLSL